MNNANFLGTPCQMFLVVNTDGKMIPQKFRYQDPVTEEILTVHITRVQVERQPSSNLIYFQCLGASDGADTEHPITLVNQVAEHRWFLQMKN
jgi:hypothetical protein